jgi:hypothetical protein
MYEELTRYRCSSEDGSYLTVLQHRYVHITRDGGKVRRWLGAVRLTLVNGEPIRYIDVDTFEVVGTGELLRRES